MQPQSFKVEPIDSLGLYKKMNYTFIYLLGSQVWELTVITVTNKIKERERERSVTGEGAASA